MRFQIREDTAPKQLTNHNVRNLSLVKTESLSGGLCGRQDSPYSPEIYAHYLSISVHLKCVASEDAWYLCKNISISFALCERILICFAVVAVVAVSVVTYLHKWGHAIIGLGNGLASVQRQATTRNNIVKWWFSNYAIYHFGLVITIIKQLLSYII